ncbi:MAG: membrane dipeptidase [Anaerolineae bacterium]
MFIVDAHQDIAYNAVCFGRDYRLSALRKRQLEANTDIPARNGFATTGLPESIAGRVALVFATLFVAPHSKRPAPWSAVMYQSPREAYQLALAQMDYYNRLADNDNRIRLVRTAPELDAVLATWEQGKPLAERTQGLVILMENADPILEAPQFEEWYERGVRIVGPAWRGTRYTGGTGEPGPLTPEGRDLLETMSSYGVVLDLSHMAEEAYFEALDLYQGPIIASHSNPRKFVNTDRHLSDEMILRLAERGGVMGVAVYNHFLSQTWTRTDTKRALPLQAVVDVIDHVCQLTGNAAHVGIGTDFDGGFGAESVPNEIDTVADLWQLGPALRERGFAENDIEAILGGNMVRKLRECLDGRAL